MDADYGARYRELYQGHWWWRAREAIILDALRRHGARRGHETILDVGCGDGLFFDRLQPFGEVWGVESAAALVRPDGPWRPQIHIGPFDATFAPARRFSIILMLDVLEHLDRPVEAVRHALSLLDDGGLLLATVPAFRALWTRHDDMNEHRTRYTKHTFGVLAREAGLAVREQAYLFQWVALGKLAVRAIEAVTPARDQVPRIPPRPINAMLSWITRAEYATFGRIAPPFGSSLLIAGRRP